MEQFDKAISYLDKIIDLNPANESALNEIGLCFEISNASKKAVDYFNKFLDKHPYSRSAWFNLAISYNSLGKNEKAIDAYEFSLAIDENQPSAYFNIANIYASMDDHPKAINYYRRTLIKESPDAITYYYLGESYEKLDRFEDALEAYQNAFEINNLFHEALLGMARSYFVLGNEEEAYLKLDDAINVEEPFPLFWSIRSLKMDELGYFELAITAIKKLIDLYPDEIIYVLSLSVLYNPHNAPESIKVLDQAMLRFSDESDQALCMYLKGLYLLKMGQKKEGLLTFESALELDKNEFDNPTHSKRVWKSCL
jgi:tetratricopeptide (TPR) repeat protein